MDKYKNRLNIREILNSLPRCGHQTKAGKECQLPAGYGTNHLGEGFCVHHDEQAKKVKRGKYGRTFEEEIVLSMEFHKDNLASNLTLVDEISALRARFEILKKPKYWENDESDLPNFILLAKTIAQLINFEANIRKARVEMMRANEISTIALAFVHALKKVIKDQEICNEIAEEWARIYREYREKNPALKVIATTKEYRLVDQEGETVDALEKDLIYDSTST